MIPEIDPGVAGIEFTLIAKLSVFELPQALLAVTVILPPLVFAVVVILFVVDAPLQPDGNVQV